MTRKDYRQFALMLSSLREPLAKPHYWDSEDIGYGRAIVDVEDRIVAILTNDNPRFDEQRFRDAALPKATP